MGGGDHGQQEADALLALQELKGRLGKGRQGRAQQVQQSSCGESSQRKGKR